jgi:hypothetical protein
MPGFAIFLVVAVAYIIGHRLLRKWILNRWIEGRLSNLGCVSILLVTSATGIATIFIVGKVLLHPSAEGLVVLLVMALAITVILGFGMTIAAYASSHGVREHLRAQRENAERERQSPKEDA